MKAELEEEMQKATVVRHRNQDLRDRTKAFAMSIIHLYVSLPKTTEVQVVGKQLLRSRTSVAANYREASRSRSKAEFISKIETCIQEAVETQFWLECLKEGCHVSSPSRYSLWNEIDELIRIFTTSARNAKS